MRNILLSICLLFCSYSRAVSFARACDSHSEELVIGAVGDVLLHDTLQMKAYRSEQNFKSLWSQLTPEIQSVDIAYANLEGPSARGINIYRREVADPGRRYGFGNVYTGYPMFNYHPSLVEDLKSTGFDVVSTANNHSLDRGSIGVNRTIEAIQKSGIHFAGTQSALQKEWFTTINKKGFNVAFIACTFSTNGIADPERKVLRCFDSPIVANIISALKKTDKYDAIIVTPHWGVEYRTQPNAQQVRYAHAWLDAGATVILGSHPHILQPIEKYKTKDGREGLIIYSLANFVSAQRGSSLYSAYFYFGLSRKGKSSWINGVRYIPIEMVNVVTNPTLQVVQGQNTFAGKFIRSILGSSGWSQPKIGNQHTNFECFK